MTIGKNRKTLITRTGGRKMRFADPMVA